MAPSKVPAATFVPSTGAQSFMSQADRASLVKDITQAVMQALPSQQTAAKPVSLVSSPPSSRDSSLASAELAPSSLGVQCPKSPSVSSTDRDSWDFLEEADLHRLQAVNTVCESLAPQMGLPVVDRSIAPGSVQSLSLFPKRKSRKSVLFSVPPEFLHSVKKGLEGRPRRALVSPQSKQIFRVKDDCWAQLTSARQPDPLLLSRTSHTEKLSKSKERYFTLENKAQAESLSFARSVGEAAAHSLRLESAAAATSQHAIKSIQGMLADPDLPTKFKDQLVSIQSAAQLSLTATAESVDIQSRVRGAAKTLSRVF